MLSATGRRPDRVLRTARHMIDVLLADLDPDNRLDRRRRFRLLAGVTHIIRCVRAILNQAAGET